MSDKVYYFVGPFLSCFYKIDENLIDKEKSFSVCDNKKCKLINKDINSIVSAMGYGKKFCPECGCQLVIKKETYKVPKFYTYDVSSKIDDKLMPVNIGNIIGYEIENDNEKINIFVPNIKIDGITRQCLFSDKDKMCCLSFNDGQPYYEKEIFEKFFNNELNIMKTFYNKVVVCWGFIKYSF